MNEKFNSQSYIQSLKDQISYLENEKCELEEKIEEFATQNISFFEKNKYSDIIRMVYEDILCMGLSTRNVEKVIKLVLEKLEGTECNRLPKSTFSKYMLIEALGLAQLQIASELADCEEDFVLQSDGISKKGHSFTIFDASKSNGQFYVLGLREVGSGDENIF